MSKYYDFDKEQDKDFLRAAGKQLVEKVIDLEIRLAQATLQQRLDEQIKSKLTGELLVLRKIIFESKQEKKEKLKELKKEKKRKKVNLVHNQNENKTELSKNEPHPPELAVQQVEHKLTTESCPHCHEQSHFNNMIDKYFLNFYRDFLPCLIFTGLNVR